MNMNTLTSLNNVAEINELVTLQSLTCLRKDCFFVTVKNLCGCYHQTHDSDNNLCSRYAIHFFRTTLNLMIRLDNSHCHLLLIGSNLLLFNPLTLKI